MHHDHDCDHHPFDPFFLIAFTHAHVLAGLGEGVEVESDPRDPETIAMHRANVAPLPDLTWTPLFAHPPIFPPRERLSRKLPDITTFSPKYPIVKLVNIGLDNDTAYVVSSNGIAFAGMEADARTWGDHGELFELPTGWRFQDNMIQGAIGEPGDKLFSVITYDGDNLPNPWEWQLHEAESSDPEALWEEVASTPDKPRSGWAPTLLAAMTRSRTAGELHIEDRRAAGGA